MAHQEATSVVAAPLEAVESGLREIESWPAFVIGVARVQRTGPDRYRFTLNDGTRPRDVDVAVTRHPREHRTTWRSLGGPACRGEWRLAKVDDGHTRVHLTLSADPTGFFEGLAEMLGSSRDTAACDLQRLEEHLLHS